MSTPDPVTAAPLFSDPTDDELHTAAVQAIGRVLARKWTNADEGALLRGAAHLVDLALELGLTQPAVILVKDNHPDAWRLAHAVRSSGPTGPCEVCGAAPYAGEPTAQDVRIAADIIASLVGGD